jgi:hypothetical protein
MDGFHLLVTTEYESAPTRARAIPALFVGVNGAPPNMARPVRMIPSLRTASSVPYVTGGTSRTPSGS